MLIELKVGQVWENRRGNVCVVYDEQWISSCDSHPFFMVEFNERSEIQSFGWVSGNGRFKDDMTDSPYDFIRELFTEGGPRLMAIAAMDKGVNDALTKYQFMTAAYKLRTEGQRET